jgi:hypothetical protein
MGAQHRDRGPWQNDASAARCGFDVFDAQAVRSVLADLDTVDGMSAAIFTAATGHTPEQVAEWERNAMTFDAHEAIKAGLAHELTA